MDSHSLINNIRNRNGEEELRQIYKEYRTEFIMWAKKKFGASSDEARDVFQQVMVIFYENIMSGRLQVLNSDVKTYIYGIGKNKLNSQFRSP